ncbi:MAG: hypothetical protein KAU90_09195 [Sulfurovaceae bacterium]|nr:hypothetical protein [Sulfurovaceae bacterium]
MKQTHIYISSILSLCLLGCGPSGSCENINLDSNTKTQNSVDIKVERGAVFMSTVVDANGTKASKNNLGLSNIYTFPNQPIYPISAKGGYIDIDGNGKLTRDDTKLDIDMVSYSNIISPLTTIVKDNNNSIEYLTKNYNISRSDIFDKVPSQTSIDTILFSNIAYRAIKNGYKIGSDEFTQTVDSIKDIYNQKFVDIKDLKQLSILLEQELLLKDKNITTPISENEITSINNNVSNQTINQTSSTDKNSTTTTQQQPEEEEYTPFAKEYKSSDSINTIWNFIIKIPTDKDINNFDIGTTLVRNSNGTKGFILIKGISLKAGQITNINSVKVFGIKASGSTGSVAYDSTNNITKNSVSIIQGDSLLINLGEIMQQQTIVSQKSFKRVSNYSVNIYISKVDILAPNIGSFSFQTDYDEYYSFPSDTKRLNGTINIKGN